MNRATASGESATARQRRPFRGQVAVRLYYAILAGVLGYTLIAQALLTHHQGRSLLNMFSYYTIESNVLVLVMSVVLAVRPGVSGPAWSVLRLAALCGITLTGVVYATVIAPYVHLAGWALIYTHVFHYVAPVAMVAGFVVIGPRAPFRYRDMVFLAWPAAWLVYTMLRGAYARPEFVGFGQPPSHYPYRFLDPGRVPAVEIAGAVVIIAVALIVLGLAYIHGERWLERRTARSSSVHP